MQLMTTQFKEMELRIMYHKLPMNRGIMAQTDQCLHVVHVHDL